MFKRLFTAKSLDKITIEGVDFTITHTLRKNMKRIIMRVESGNRLKVSSAGVSGKRLESFVTENSRWILAQSAEIKNPYRKGAPFYYLNRAYTIKHHDQALRMNESEVFINPELAKKQSDEFYKKKAKAFLPERVKLWESKMGIASRGLGFRLAKRRWGSCNVKGEISLNPYMMKLSIEMIDYIIVHELSHLVHLNHSKAFYELVESHMPAYKKIEKNIKSFSLGSSGV